MNSEPVALSALIAAVVQAVLALLVAFGIDLTEGQTAAILGASGAVLALAAALYARRRVTPTP